MRSKNILVIGGILLGLSQATLGGESLCNKGEKVYFSCNVANGKTVSLCGNAYKEDRLGVKEEIDNPYLQYRFGRRLAVEMEYPRNRENSVDRFKSEQIKADGGRLHSDAVIFVNGGIAYSVEHFAPDSGQVIGGVRVGDPQSFGLERKGKRRVKYPDVFLACSGPINNKSFVDLIDFIASQKLLDH